MHQFNADTYPTVMEAMWSQAAIVWYYVRHNELDKADAAYAKMLDVFKDQKTLPKEVFQIGDIYTEVGNTAKARLLLSIKVTVFFERSIRNILFQQRMFC